MKTKNTIKTFEKFACNSLRCDRSELQWFIKNNPTRAIVLAEKYHKAKSKETIESVTDEELSIHFKVRPDMINGDFFIKGAEWLKKELLKRLDNE